MSADRWWEALALLALAWAVAVPVSSWFAGARAVEREPVAALIAWQAIGLAGGMAALTAELTLAAVAVDGPRREAVPHVLRHPFSAGAFGVVGVVLFALSVLWLLGVLGTSTARVVSARRTHRAVLELLSERIVTHGTAVDVLTADDPVAYSVPGRDPRVVMSTATRSRLDGKQLRAVLTHERTHLRQHHDVLVQPFVAWERSLPMLTAARRARCRVEQLVELVCDDAAVAGADRLALAAALEAMNPGGAAVGERIARLRLPRRRDPVLRIGLMAGAVLLALGPPALVVLTG